MTTPGVSHPSATTVEDFPPHPGRAVRAAGVPAPDRPGQPPHPRVRGAGQGTGGLGPFTEAVRGGLAAPLTLFVNAEPVSLGVACPDDLRPAEAGHIINNVRAQAERTDAVVIAEGIETIKHARQAVAAVAAVGQGFLFGHPAPLGSAAPTWPPTTRCAASGT